MANNVGTANSANPTRGPKGLFHIVTSHMAETPTTLAKTTYLAFAREEMGHCGPMTRSKGGMGHRGPMTESK